MQVKQSIKEHRKEDDEGRETFRSMGAGSHANIIPTQSSITNFQDTNVNCTAADVNFYNASVPVTKNEDHRRPDPLVSSQQNFMSQATLSDAPTALSQNKIMSMFYNSKDTLRLLNQMNKH